MLSAPGFYFSQAALRNGRQLAAARPGVVNRGRALLDRELRTQKSRPGEEAARRGVGKIKRASGEERTDRRARGRVARPSCRCRVWQFH